MEAIVYLRYSDLFRKRVSIATLKKTLRQFNPINILFSLSRINVLLCRQHVLNRGQEKMRELQDLLAANYLDDEIREKKLHNIYDPYANPVFSRQQILFLVRLCILECSEKGTRVPEESQDAKFELGESCLIASDYLVSQKEERATSEGSSSKRIRHFGYQLGPMVELYNPVRLKNAVVRSEIIYSEILESKEFRKRLPHKLANFGMHKKFLSATGISITQHREFTIAFLSNLLSTTDKDLFDNPNLLTFKRQQFLSTSKARQKDLDSFLDLESKNKEQFKKLLVSQSRFVKPSLSYIAFKSTPLLEVYDDTYISIDPCFLIEKLGSGIYWRILDILPPKEKSTFLELYGILFETYVNRLLGEIPPQFVPSPEYENGDMCFDGMFYYPDTKHLLVLEHKASFMRIDAKYGRRVRVFEKELTKKFVFDTAENRPKGVGQLARHIEYLFTKEKSKRRHLKEVNSWVDEAEKVSPILICQEPLLRFQAIEGRLNKKFNQLLNAKKLRSNVRVNQLTVIDIDTLERIKPYLAQNIFTLEQAINSRSHRDREYKTAFYSFLYENFGELQKDLQDSKIEEKFALVFDRTKGRFFDVS